MNRRSKRIRLPTIENLSIESVIPNDDSSLNSDQSTSDIYLRAASDVVPCSGNNDFASSQPSTTSGEHVPQVTRTRLRGVQQSQAAKDRRGFGPQPDSPPPQSGKQRRRPGQKPPAEQNTEDEHSLYVIMKSGMTPIQEMCDEWREKYKTNREEALVSLMQFFINSSGCKNRITTQMLSTMEHFAIIQKITNEFYEESIEYPFIMSGQRWKKFRQDFCDFVQTLIKQCQYSIIYDQFLMDNIISLLTGLSDSQVRAFRHTATVAVLKLMTALVDVALTVSVQQDNSHRQYEAERKKSRGTSDRLETLLLKRQELEENIDEIKNMLTYMFKSVFTLRYRDTLPEIRGISMSEIGIWMQKFQTNFLDDSYLKYIGWTLHDQVGDVRLRCLLALQPLYASEELKGKLELFTNKFKNRIVALTLDREYDVAVQAVRLVISIHKHHKDILSDRDCEQVYELVYAPHRQVAQVAGEFLKERIFQPNGVDLGKSKRGKRRLPNTPFIIDLVQFFIESELPEHGAYLVDSLIDSNDMLKDWECMIDLLLEEPGPNEEALDNQQETSLIYIMVCCVRQAATGEVPIGRKINQKAISMKEQKIITIDKKKLTEHFIETLPSLLRKYKADQEKLRNLVAIPQYFDLIIYSNNRQNNKLSQLLKTLHEVVKMHHEIEVLETCAKTLEYLCNENEPIFSNCDVARSTIIDMIVTGARKSLDKYKNLITSNDQPTEDDIYDVTVTLKKVAVFYTSHNLNKWGLWQDLFEALTSIFNELTLPFEAIKYCISSCNFYLMWGLQQAKQLIEDGENLEVDLEDLNRKLNDFMETALRIVETSSDQILKEEAYTSMCNLLLVFRDQLAIEHYQLSTLIYKPPEFMPHILNSFVQQCVFIEEENGKPEKTRIEELLKRRNLLASYCKLISYNIMPTKTAADILKHYVKYNNEYGDIIKSTLGKAREINKTNCALTMCISLAIMFTELQEQKLRVKEHKDFSSLKELAKRFALSFGIDAVKNREAIAALHQRGILFAVKTAEPNDDPTSPPPNLAFFEILTEFTNKLLKQDKMVVLNYLDRRIPAGMASSKGEDWQPFLQYRHSLINKGSETAAVAPNKAYRTKKRDIGPIEKENHNYNIDDSSDQDD